MTDLERKQLSRQIAKRIVPGTHYPSDQNARRIAKAAALAAIEEMEGRKNA
jgi:hypothetical protein